MIKQIFKQIWFYRRSNAWLFLEMTLIVVASWFLVNTLWPDAYRKNLPDGFDPKGVYALQVEPLYSEQDGYREEMDTPEQLSADYHRIGQALRNIPQIRDLAPVGATMPGLNMSNYNRGVVIDTAGGIKKDMAYGYHVREAGAGDMSLMGYRLIWPENTPVEDVPGTVIITEDLSKALFGDENPVGRRLSEFSDTPEFNYRISGVIAPVKVSKDQEYKPFVMYAGADITKIEEGMGYLWLFTLAPGTDREEFIRWANKAWSKQMAFGNWRVYSVLSVEDLFDSTASNNFTWTALLVFLLVCILIGVASFSWLRTRERRGEIGVRRAMGSSVCKTALPLLAEVWILQLLSLIVGLVIVLNILIVGKIDFCPTAAYRGHISQITIDSLPLLFDPVLHFLCVSGIIAAILLAIVTVSTAVPVAGALKESPADVLKDE